MIQVDMRRPTVRILLLALGLAVSTVRTVSATDNPAQESDPAQQSDPPRVILLIADGTGIAHWTVGLLATDSAAILRFPVVGLVDTRNVEGRITDSAASATAFATGVLTYNRAIGVGPDSMAIETVLERAASRGMATGLVATSSLVHATPASFATHVPDRYQYEEIARQLAGSPVDVLLGGGREFFDPGVRKDGRDYLSVLGRNRRWAVGEDDLAGAPGTGGPGLVGLFADNEMPTAEQGRSPTLAKMTAAAIEVLDRNPEGFFLMVEASQIDWLAHDNEPFDRLAPEILDCDAAIRVALEFVSTRPGALLIVVADHETGGLAVVDEDGRWATTYSSRGHTAEFVPLFASGAGAERFGGTQRIDEIGRRLGEVVSGKQSAD
jgi:alkaline phosphatase